MAKCWTTIERPTSWKCDRRLALGWPRSKAAFIDSQRADFRFERRARNAESRGRARGPEHASAARPQRLLDDRLLVTRERAGQRDRALDPRPGGQPALVDREFSSVADDHRPLDHVLQLPHVARPRIRPQVIERPLVDPPDRLARLPRVAIDEV